MILMPGEKTRSRSNTANCFVANALAKKVAISSLALPTAIG